MGTVEPGKLADLLVVDGDPLRDIAVLRDREKLKIVMKGGEAFVNKLEASVPASIAVGD